MVGWGTIVSSPEFKDTGQFMIVRIHSQCLSGYLIKIKTRLEPRFSYGDKINFEGKITRPFNFQSSDGKTFDYKGYLAKDNIFFEIKSARVYLLTSKNTSGQKSEIGFWGTMMDKYGYYLAVFRRGLTKNISSVLGEPHASLASGLVLGEKSSLGNDLIDDFRRAGLIHIVVLSGFNITIVGEIIKKILSPFPRNCSLALGALSIISFGVMVGGGATVVRSTIMALIQYFGTWQRKDYRTDRALYFSGLIMIIQNPLILAYDPSFHLSFLATLGLMMLAKPISNIIKFLPEKVGFREIIASTIATQIFVLPYLIYLMGQVSIIGLITNILILPIIPPTMAIVALIGLSGFISYKISELLGYVGHLFLSYELKIVQIFSKLSFASIQIGYISQKTMFSMYASLGLFLHYIGITKNDK
jgi:competence protein ComEC